MRINTNVNAMIATNQMTKNTALSGASMEKLSTGLRITKAGDDATGLAISEKMRSQIRGMEQADRNVQDGISMVQTAEGAMEEIGNITQRMRELTVQASNETNSSDDRTKITAELKQLNSEITRIAESTTFNNQKILEGNGNVAFEADAMSNSSVTDLTIANTLDGVEKIRFTVASTASTAISHTHVDITLELLDENGQTLNSQKLEALQNDNTDDIALNFKELGISFTLGSNTDVETLGGEIEVQDTANTVKIQAGANNEESNTLSVRINGMTSEKLGIKNEMITKIGDKNLANGTEAAKEFIDVLDNALSMINTSRSTLGAQQNRLEYTSSNLTSSTENLSAAESRIRDVDVAKEMVKLSKLNILNQASQAMVSQAKQQPESVSQLLR